MPNPTVLQAAMRDFQAARQQAALQEALARLTGKSNQLLSYEEVARKLRLSAKVERGVQSVPVAAIVGSVGRYSDFTRTFLPRQADDVQRWSRVKAAFADAGSGAGLPPIDLYRVGEAYFVLDGNHRVSIARQQKMEFIDARVIEVQSPVPLTPDVQPDDLIVKAEYADFLDATGLAERRPNIDLSLTVPGQYSKLMAQIQVQHDLMAQAQGREVSAADAAANWYDQVYAPFVEAIRDRGLLRWFPGRTETDLYLWVWEHHEMLRQELGWVIRPEAAVTDLAVLENARAGSAEAAPGNWRKTRLLDRYTEQLFMDILVPISGEPESWQALEQAICIAEREGSRLHGLHIVNHEAQKKSAEALAVQARFNERCATAGLSGSMAIETGKVGDKICERALLADLVVLYAAHPPPAGLPSLGSGLRSILWRLARPVLAVPHTTVCIERAMLAYDGSPKAKEALFVATYLAEMWKTALTVVAIPDPPRVSANVLDYARDYLEMHEIQGECIVLNGRLDLLLDLIKKRGFDLVILGGYSMSAVEEVMVGSAVNWLLRESPCPLLICR
ncbi:MAG: universal stress protein [Anaerolineae bacterium]